MLRACMFGVQVCSVHHVSCCYVFVVVVVVAIKLHELKGFVMEPMQFTVVVLFSFFFQTENRQKTLIHRKKKPENELRCFQFAVSTANLGFVSNEILYFVQPLMLLWLLYQNVMQTAPRQRRKTYLSAVRPFVVISF